MTWNIAPEVVSLIFLLIIWTYSRKGSHLPSFKNRTFQLCLVITFIAIGSNILSTFMIYYLHSGLRWMTWIVTTVYFLFTPLMGLIYFTYAAAVLFEGSSSLRRGLVFWMIPGVAYSLVVLANPLTGMLFTLSADGYERGGCLYLTYLVFYFYCLASLSMTVIHRKQIERTVYSILAAFPHLAVFVIFIQQIYPEIILTGSAATCAMLIIYLHLQNRQISRDYLTNVPNRQELLDMMGLLIKKHPEKQFTLAVVSLRQFRQINNVCGQHKGDEFLRKICGYLCEIGPRDGVYRFSGDEFALLFTSESDGDIKECLAAIRERMKQPWEVEEYRFTLSVAVGVIRRTRSGDTLETAINSIEYAVFQAKTVRHGFICYCDEVMLAELERRNSVIQILKDELKNPSFEMYYQPIYSAEDGAFHYAESLMRLNHTPIGPVYPSEFIPVAEETGLIIEITYIILDKVCKYINRLTEQGIEVGAIHVNFSAVQFSEPDLAQKVLDIIKRNGTPFTKIKIEFTESTLAENPRLVTEFAYEMNQYGIMIGLDDFGTGYSNISTVFHIPFGTVKLDKSLVYAAMEKKTAFYAVRNLISAFKNLGMRVIAEGVETEEQKRLVLDCQVDQIQGFYYSRPMSEDDMEAFMLAQRDSACAGS